jgi:hypothetical protein
MKNSNSNVAVVGYTKKNLSPVIRVGFADCGDFSVCCHFAVKRGDGDIYRVVKLVEEFYTPEKLPEEAKWVLESRVELSVDTLKVVETINKEFSTQSGSLAKYIPVYFEYQLEFCCGQTGQIKCPTAYAPDYHPMSNAIEYRERFEKAENSLRGWWFENHRLIAEIETLKERVFDKFFVGKLGKKKVTRDAQQNRFISAILEG